MGKLCPLQMSPSHQTTIQSSSKNRSMIFCRSNPSRIMLIPSSPNTCPGKLNRAMLRILFTADAFRRQSRRP